MGAGIERLLIMVKAPRLGFAKTRLGLAIGPEKARLAYLEMVRQLVNQLAPISDVQLRFTPDDAHSEVAGWLHPGWTAAPQGEGDLGIRLARAFADLFSQGARRIVAIGADCPWVISQDILGAWEKLHHYDVVLGPAKDGGYWLIGLRQSCPHLFEGIPWSSSSVFSETERRTRELGLSLRRCRELSDIDTAEDWSAYCRQHPVGEHSPDEQ